MFGRSRFNWRTLAAIFTLSGITLLLYVGWKQDYQNYRFCERYLGLGSEFGQWNLEHPSQSSLLRKIGEKAIPLFLQDEKDVVKTWMNKGNLRQDDPLWVAYVREKFLVPPDNSKPYNLNSTQNPSEGQSQAIWSIFENLKTEDRFFIECGAFDGEFLSNTLWLEKEKGWNGLLIEADPVTYPKLRLKNRKAWHANVCLSPNGTAQMRAFFQSGACRGGACNGLKGSGKGVEVPCLAFYTMMLALNRTVIDYFSLDIEGVDFDVLKSIPFDKIQIKTLSIEKISADVNKFMVGNGYTLFRTIVDAHAYDSIFVLTSLLPANFKFTQSKKGKIITPK